jgi:rod shape-determining protein MreC
LSQSRLKKQITINKGSSDGVKIGQVVLGADGILGQVSQVTPLYSSVLLITDPTQHVPVKNERNGIRGISKGVTSYQGKLMVRFIQHGLDVKVGDVFLSSAIGSKFPSGYPVGRVTHVEKQEHNPFLTIELTPSQSIEQLELVLINNTLKKP